MITREIKQKFINLLTKMFFVFWIGIVVFVYTIVYWPPVLWQVAEGLGITGFVWNMQVLIKPFFTAPFAPN